MGTRVQKIIGYGAPSDGAYNELFDRLDEGSKKGEVHELLFATYEKTKLANGLDALNLAFETNYPGNTQKYPETFLEVIHYAEYPDDPSGNIVFLAPGMMTRWYRFDDYMDHEQAVIDDPENPLKTVVHRIDRPLYPYVSFMDATTGALIKDEHPMRVKQIHGDRAVPMVPEAIRAICEHVRPGGDPKFWLKLRPMMVTWWS